MDTELQHTLFLKRIQQRFGPRLEAVIISKDETRAFVIVRDAQSREERSKERIDTYDMELHGLQTAEPDFLAGWSSDSKILYDKNDWKSKLLIK